MERRGWKKNGRKGSVGVRGGSSSQLPAHNRGGLSLWFVRAERYRLEESMPFRSVTQRCKELEATIVYQTDELVSQANAIKEIQNAQSEDGKVWSNFVFIKGRKYYIKEAHGEDWTKTDPGRDTDNSESKLNSDKSGSREDLFAA